MAINLNQEVVQPIRAMAEETIDRASILSGALSPFVSIADKVAKAYQKHLYGEATLQDLPDDTKGEGPRFVINATNVQSGALWRFSRPYMGDYRVGRVLNPRTSLAVAVGASSAFPPILSPAVLPLEPGQFVADSTTDLQMEPYTKEVILSDGGVYDNLGLETAWKRYKTILVSDGGGKMQADPEPKTDWARHSLRINEIIDNQVRSLRKRQLIEAFKKKTEHDGAYWGIRTLLRDFPKPGNLDCPPDKTLELASTPTRLKALDSRYQERLINWGYAVCAAAIESHVQPSPIGAGGFSVLWRNLNQGPDDTHEGTHVEKMDDPTYRYLRGYALDPGFSTKLDTAEINEVVYRVPYERLEPGPVGEYVEVIDFDPASKCWYEPVNLGDEAIASQQGLAPSEGNPQFHQQFVYAVVMKTIRHFERALGRKIVWFPRREFENGRIKDVYVQQLRIYPHGFRDANAYYDPDKTALLFGYFSAAYQSQGANYPGGLVFTCLSPDIVAHETTHAILDSIHHRYMEDTNPDVAAFHEGFADIVALLQRFTFSELVEHQLYSSRGANGKLLPCSGNWRRSLVKRWKETAVPCGA